jgi:hypothetical protein
MASSTSQDPDNVSAASAPDSTASQIRKLYVDSTFPGAGSGLTTFYRALKDGGKDAGLSIDQVRGILSDVSVFNTQVAHTPRNFPRRHVESLGQGLSFHADLIFLPECQGYHYLYAMIDVHSHFAYIKPLKNKEAASTKRALEELIKEHPFELSRMFSITCDKGTEFKKEFLQFATEKHIKIFTLNPPTHASLIEQFNRTFKSRLMALCRASLTDDWVSLAPQVVKGINETYNTAVGAKPALINSPYFDSITREKLRENRKRRDRERRPNKNLPAPIFEVGQYVFVDFPRSSMYKTFDLRRGPIYTVARVNKNRPNYMYYVRENFGKRKLIPEGIYGYQMIKAPDPSANPDQPLPIEKVLKTRVYRKRKQHLVKFLFYPRRRVDCYNIIRTMVHLIFLFISVMLSGLIRTR